MPRSSNLTLSTVSESLLWVIGILCLCVFLLLTWQRQATAQEAVRSFYSDRALRVDDIAFDQHAVEALNASQSLWSEARIDAFDRLRPKADSVVAVLRIPGASLEAPIFVGANDEELDRGPGWIRGTSEIGEDGNIGIAGHRDGFFRLLKDVKAGDVIELLEIGSLREYEITDIWTVDPSDVYVLEPTNFPSITLVTCFPFYFVGSAPERYIVRATLIDEL